MSEITNGMSGLEAREILNVVTTRPYTDWGLTNYIILGGEFEAAVVEALLVTNLVEFDYDPEDNATKFKATRPYAINFPVPLPITSWYDDACVSIAKEVFKDNSILESMEFTNLRSIGPSAFESASALTSVNMPLLTEIPAAAFRFCGNLADVSFDSAEIVKSSPNAAFENSGVTGINDTNFPSLITVESGAFGYSSNLAVINNTSITDWQGTFSNLAGLTTINLPNVTTLSGGGSMFTDCASLTTIDIPVTLPLNGYNFQGCSSLVTFTGSDITLDSTTITGGANFKNCSSLTELSIADCTEITGGNNFEGCSSLTELSLPLVTTLTGGNNFKDCTDLTEISLDTLVNLTNTEFSGCTSLTTIYMPQLSVTGEVNIFDGLPDDGAITVNSDINSDTNWTTVVEPYLDGKGWTITYFSAIDPDAQAYLDAVEAAGGTVNSTISEATNTLFVSLKDANIYSKLDVFYPMIGGTYNSIRIEGKLQNTYYLTENGSWTYDSNGATTTGTTVGSTYFNTQYNCLTNLTSANSSYSTYWVNTHNYTPSNDQYFSGAYTAQTEMWSLNPYNSTGWNFIGYRNGEGPNFNPATAGILTDGGYFINSELNVSGTDTIQGMVNTATYVSQAMSSPTNLPNTNFFLGSISLSGSPYNSIPGTYNFLHIGEGLTQSEMTELSTIVNTFQTTLGRNTY